VTLQGEKLVAASPLGGAGKWRVWKWRACCFSLRTGISHGFVLLILLFETRNPSEVPLNFHHPLKIIAVSADFIAKRPKALK